jgi:hypothetical protein
MYVVPKAGVTTEEVNEKLDLALDWYKYDTNSWVVRTSADQNKWFARLQPLVEPDGSLFIAKLDLANHQGWMSADFWEWISAAEKKQGKTKI